MGISSLEIIFSYFKGVMSPWQGFIIMVITLFFFICRGHFPLKPFISLELRINKTILILTCLEVFSFLLNNLYVSFEVVNTMMTEWVNWILWQEYICWVECWASYEIRGLSPMQSVSSVVQACPTLCDPMDCSMPGFPVHHQLPELAPTHVHQVGDAIQPSHPLSSPSPPAFNLIHHQGLF